MTGTRFYSDTEMAANPLAYGYAVAATANTTFIASLTGPVSNIIYIRRPPAVLKVTFKSSVAGKLTLTASDGTTTSDYELSDNGSDYTAGIQVERYITIGRMGGSPANFPRITVVKFSATGTIDISITELNGA